MRNIYAHSWQAFFVFYALFGPCVRSFGAEYNMGPYETVAVGYTYSADDVLNITGGTTIENHGAIYATLNIVNNCDLSIENTGVFDATVVRGDNISITQVIRNNDDITRLNGINDNYDVLINTNAVDILNWNEIIVNTIGAEKYKLQNANLRMDGVTGINNVVISGNVMIYTDAISNVDTALISSLSGTGTLNIVSSGLDRLHSVESYTNSGNVFVRVVRSSDYGTILNNNTGKFLNYLREKSPDDKLLWGLDSQNTLSEINDVLGRSVKIHPIKMMRSLKTMYSHKSLETMHIAQDSEIGIMPITMFSNDVFVMGAEPYLNLSLDDDLHMKISGKVFNIRYSDDINLYSAMSYGVGADVVYDLPTNNFVRVYGGLDFSVFDSGFVFDGNSVSENPNGFSGYMVGEFGRKFDFDDGYYISPFVMLGGDYATILNSDEFGYYIGAGSNVGFSTEFDGFRYDYVARGIVRSDGGLGAELNVAIWSLADSAGAGIRAGVFYDSVFKTTYHIALDAKFDF